MIHEVDVAIVGAGAAAVGAARLLHGRVERLLVLEASARVGGRAWTETMSGLPLDLGCGWLHSATRNPWVGLAEAQGIPVDRTQSAWGTQFRNLGFAPDEQAAAGEAFDRLDRRLRGTPPASDRASDVLTPGDRWNSYLEALSGYINGASLASLSVADYLAYDDAATDTNWRVEDGYGTLVVRSLPPVPLALATPVTRIDDRETLLTLETPQGVLRAKAAIVTVPPPVLASGALALPPSHADRCHAAACLPLGLANKLFLSLADPHAVDADSHLLGNPHAPDTGSYYLRPFGWPVVECFFGGTGAAELEAAGLDGATAFARKELGRLLGSDFARGLHLVAGSAWGGADGFGGAYSHALPGHASARQRLTTSTDGRLFFAGEACSPTDFSTAHGALATGEAAARAALAALT